MSEANIIEMTLAKERVSLDERELLFRKYRAKLLSIVSDLYELGCEFSFPNSIDVRLIGDKHKFLVLLRTLAKHGMKPPKVEKGATGFSHFWYPETIPGLKFYITFSSTVCKRVKVGTKMVEKDVYETVCDEIMPYGR